MATILPLGSAKSGNFQIGNAELRFGPLTSAGALTQDNSVGLTESTSVKVDQQRQELKAGLPKQLVDSVITETTVNVTANAYEYTRKNIKVMLNEGTDATTPATIVAKGVGTGTLTSLSLVMYATTAVTTGTGATTGFGINQGDLYGVYPTAAGKQADFSVVKVGTLAWATATVISSPTTAQKADAAMQGVPTTGSLYSTTVTVTLNAATPLLTTFTAGDAITAYTMNQVGIGNSAQTQYVTLDVISLNHKTGLPQGFRFWKASVSGGLDYSFSNDNFAVTPLSFSILQPSAEDWAGALAGPAAAMSASAPLGFYWSGQL